MRYETVQNKEELDFRVKNYKQEGYKIKWENGTNVKIVKDDFNIGVFLLLLLFFVIGGLIYAIIKSGSKDTVVISIDGNYNVPEVKEFFECRVCGEEFDSKEKYCPYCGIKV